MLTRSGLIACAENRLRISFWFLLEWYRLVIVTLFLLASIKQRSLSLVFEYCIWVEKSLCNLMLTIWEDSVFVSFFWVRTKQLSFNALRGIYPVVAFPYFIMLWNEVGGHFLSKAYISGIVCYLYFWWLL